jgi:hypothetical protein
MSQGNNLFYHILIVIILFFNLMIDKEGDVSLTFLLTFSNKSSRLLWTKFSVYKFLELCK